MAIDLLENWQSCTAKKCINEDPLQYIDKNDFLSFICKKIHPKVLNHFHDMYLNMQFKNLKTSFFKKLIIKFNQLLEISMILLFKI